MRAIPQLVSAPYNYVKRTIYMLTIYMLNEQFVSALYMLNEQS